jgi:hypothetical protein
MNFDLADLPTQPLTLTLADVDSEMFERTIPAGQFTVNPRGTTAQFSDSAGLIAPGITGVKIKLRDAATQEYDLHVKGDGADLELLDKDHIAIALETDEAAFVKTRTFRPNAKRTNIKVVER